MHFAVESAQPKKILSILEEKQNTKIRFIYNKIQDEKTTNSDISIFLDSYKYILDIAHETIKIPELKLTNLCTLIKQEEEEHTEGHHKTTIKPMSQTSSRLK